MKLREHKIKIEREVNLQHSYTSRLRRILDETANPMQVSRVAEDIIPITFPPCTIGEPLSSGAGISWHWKPRKSSEAPELTTLQ